MSLLEFPSCNNAKKLRAQQEYERAVRLGRLVPRDVIRKVFIQPEIPKPPTNIVVAPIAVVRPYLIYRQYPSFDDVLHVVAKFYGVRQLDIKSHRRTADIVRPRQVVMFLMRELTETSLPTVGRLLAGRDHTTVLHGIRKIVRVSLTDERLRDELDLIKIKISELMAARNSITRQP